MTEFVRVTHRNIAEKFGCSRSTVSLALSGHPRIRESVRREIRELADKMGYHEDPSLAMLARNRFAARSAAFRASLAYVVNSRDENYGSQKRHLAAAKARAEARGYQVFEFDLAAYPSGDAACNVLYNRGVQGVMVSDMPLTTKPFFTCGKWDRFSVVCCALGWLRVPYHVVNKDVFEGTRLVWQEVARRGYRRIGGAMFRHDPIAEDDFPRYGASLAQQEELLPSDERIPILRCHVHDRKGFLKWFERFRPEVIISFISSPYDWLLEEGYRVPEDVAFTCMLVNPGEQYTGLLSPDKELAEAAVDFLIAQIHSNQHGVPEIQQAVLLEPVWTEGSTLPKTPPKSSRSERPALKSRKAAKPRAKATV
ncbi:MAG TPA: hypothetical protein VMM36_11910 [Opitutaceae bacterium]|nr:hypothetical protein [Opitutaceae bacterium]